MKDAELHIKGLISLLFFIKDDLENGMLSARWNEWYSYHIKKYVNVIEADLKKLNEEKKNEQS